MRESDYITTAKGVGDKTALAFKKAGVDTLRDLLMYLPYRYDKFAPPIIPSDEYVGKVVSILATISSSPMLRRSRSLAFVTANLAAKDSFVNAIWFNMPYIKNNIKRGDKKIFRGRLSKNEYGYSIEQPSIYEPENYIAMTNSLQPAYRGIKGITPGKIKTIIKDVIDNIVMEEDFLSDDIKGKYGLIDRDKAIETMHFPLDEESLLNARKRLVFEEFLLFIISIRRMRNEKKSLPNNYDFSKHSYFDVLRASLPYELTNAQQNVLDEIKNDLVKDKLMNRLIQGDVGSGKTILAFLALVLTAENGYQGALMAPTEVLCVQHYNNISQLFEEHNISFKPLLLTGSMTAKEKREAYEKIANHEVDIVIGTHALIQEGVSFDNLALVITDEQHRFGVRQRETLADKSKDAPHVIVMSATPIPRTLAIIIYGDLDISVLDEMPKNRVPIKNCVVDTSYRPKAYGFILNEIKAGHQAYIVCPKVNGEDDDEGENVVDYTKLLETNLPPFVRIKYLHGKMKASEKNEIMSDFANKKIDVLVSTTVIEVGVDVEDATVMMIEDAQRFGLATLHQLRGRVGRGKAQSYCFFINSSNDPNKSKRLSILNESNDGFKIASEDLKLRGPGDVFGIRQSGALAFNIGDIFTDSNILKTASMAADELIEGENLSPSLEKKLDSYISQNLERLSL